MSYRFAFLSACLGILTACAVAPPEDLDEGGAEESGPSDVPRIGSNSLSPEALASSALTTAALDATSAAAMGQTEDARTVLLYAVGCALDPSQSISFMAGGHEHTFTGAMALAPGWAKGALSASDAAWVSACVFARTNLTSTMVWVSARGQTTSLAATQQELDEYRIEEGAFWGNIFLDLGPLSAYSCNGIDQASDDSYGDLPLRECAQADGVPGSGLSPCRMHYVGLCSDACTTSGTYANCAGPGQAPVAEVITTMLLGASLGHHH